MKTIKDVLLDGFWIMPSTPAFVEGGEIPYITSKNIKVGKIDFSNVQYISREDFKTISKNRPIKINDLLISMIGTLGNVAIVKETDGDFYGQNMYLLRLNPEVINLDYFYHFFNSDVVKRYIEGKKNKSTQGYLKANHIEEIIIPVPNLEKQKEISLRFKAINALIDNRKEQLEKLDQLVKSRFIELFGDPVTNEKNWARLTLGDICEIGSSKRVFEKDYVPKGVPFFRTKEIVELSKGNPISTELFITEEHFEELRKIYGAPKKDDLLISAVGTIGTIWIVSGDFEFYFKDGNLIQIKSSPNFNSIFMKYLLDELITNYKKEMSTGTAYSALTIAGLKKMLVYDVPLFLQEQFASFVEQTDKSKLAVQQSLEKLETLKKSLMQKYFG